MIRRALLAALLAAAGCAPRGAAVPPVSVRRLLADNPIAPGQAVKLTEVRRNRRASFHLVQIATREKPHRHEKHTGMVLLVAGRGTLHLDGAAYPLAEGSVIEIPRGLPHYFVNEADGPSAAWVTFTPPFDGKDVVPVEEAPGARPAPAKILE